MQTPLRQLLAQYREHSQTEREKGTYFERLAIVFMQRDPGMAQEYEDCWDYATWARQRAPTRSAAFWEFLTNASASCPRLRIDFAPIMRGEPRPLLTTSMF